MIKLNDDRIEIFKYKRNPPIENLEIDYISGNNTPGIGRIRISNRLISYAAPNENFGEPSKLPFNKYFNVHSSTQEKYITLYVHGIIYNGEENIQIIPIYNNIFNDMIESDTTVTKTLTIKNTKSENDISFTGVESSENISIEYSFDNTTFYNNAQTFSINAGETKNLYLKITKLNNVGSVNECFIIKNDLENIRGHLRIKKESDIGYEIILNDGTPESLTDLSLYGSNLYTEGNNKIQITAFNEYGLSSTKIFNIIINEYDSIVEKPLPLSFFTIENKTSELIFKSFYKTTDDIMIKILINDSDEIIKDDIDTPFIITSIDNANYLHNEEINIKASIIIDDVESDYIEINHIVKKINYRNPQLNLVYNNNIAQATYNKSNFEEDVFVIDGSCSDIKISNKNEKSYFSFTDDQEYILVHSGEYTYINSDWVFEVDEYLNEQYSSPVKFESCNELKFFINGELVALFDFVNKKIISLSFRFAEKFDNFYIPEAFLFEVGNTYISNGEEAYIRITDEGMEFYYDVDDSLNNAQLGDL